MSVRGSISTELGCPRYFRLTPESQHSSEGPCLAAKLIIREQTFEPKRDGADTLYSERFLKARTGGVSAI